MNCFLDVILVTKQTLRNLLRIADVVLFAYLPDFVEIVTEFILFVEGSIDEVEVLEVLDVDYLVHYHG